jgi:hypothetical protein
MSCVAQSDEVYVSPYIKVSRLIWMRTDLHLPILYLHLITSDQVVRWEISLSTASGLSNYISSSWKLKPVTLMSVYLRLISHRPRMMRHIDADASCFCVKGRSAIRTALLGLGFLLLMFWCAFRCSWFVFSETDLLHEHCDATICKSERSLHNGKHNTASNHHVLPFHGNIPSTMSTASTLSNPLSLCLLPLTSNKLTETGE